MQENKITDNELEQVSGGTQLFEVVTYRLPAGTYIYNIPKTYHGNIIYTADVPTLCKVISLDEQLPKIRLVESPSTEGYVVREALYDYVV